MNIPFHKPVIPKSFDKLYSESIHNGWLTTGPIVQDFEKKIREYTNSKYTILKISSKNNTPKIKRSWCSL